ncbi:uncharacterized protein LOC107407881 isoform X3 [Ziziphus jujuba]|uniref:Uncharacterized protein LOC107407881 isoform X3 n=1 Tax=Ziziphus jujuba TaxID=326968 RepID=A0ABM3I8Z5_ZIZJJ|nr:uncharacterized protein LOC107407881 isoform X3 [Ziziphus jujuba]
MDDEDWVKVAMNDNAMVVDLLLQLSKAALPQPPTSSFPKLAWSVRQRRSKHVLRHQVDMKKKGEPLRASPTTPLSWSGATSVSCGGALDGFEESSKPKNSARSKVSVRREATTSKRPRKKKTLAQLKEEVNAQMREKMDLRNELAALRLTYEKETAINERLKRLQQSQQTMKSLATAAASGDAISHQLEQVVAVCEPTTVLPSHGHPDKPDSLEQLCPSNESCKLQEAEKKVSAFTLPDLNLPLEESVAC